MKSFGHYQIYKTNDTYHFILNLIAIPFIGLQRDYSFNGPVWSVSIEVVSYVLFGTLMVYLSRVPKLIYAVTLISLVLFIFQKPRLSMYMYESILFFFIGVLLFKLHQCKTSKIALISVVIFTSYLILKLLSIFQEEANFIEIGFQIFNLNLIIPFSLIILIVTLVEKHGGKTNRFFASFCDWVGNLTYSMYLIHVPLQMIIMTALDYLNIVTPTVASRGIFLLTFLIVLVAISHLSYRFFEKPLRSYIQKL